MTQVSRIADYTEFRVFTMICLPVLRQRGIGKYTSDSGLGVFRQAILRTYAVDLKATCFNERTYQRVKRKGWDMIDVSSFSGDPFACEWTGKVSPFGMFLEPTEFEIEQLICDGSPTCFAESRHGFT